MLDDLPLGLGEGSPDAITTRQELAAALTRLRDLAGLTVRDVARATGVPHSTIGGYMSGRHLPPVSGPGSLTAILAACGVLDAAEVQRWQEALSRLRRMPGPRPADAPAPYKGLGTYEPGDAEWFFGRHQLTRTVVERLAQRWTSGGGPVAVTGPSGCGKSSLLRAGVVATLRDGWPGVGGGRRWRVVLFTPGKKPMDAFAAALALETNADPEELAIRLRKDARRCVELLSDAGWIIVVDQFEEVFTECADDTQRQAFLRALLDCSTASGGGADQPPAAVVLAMRADFYHQALLEPLLVPVLRDAQVPVGPMSDAELRDAIVGPARKAGLEIEDGLVELLRRDLAPAADGPAAEAAHEAGALPLLSHALLAMWERATGRRLTVTGYEAVGGVRGAVARSADEVFGSLPDEGRGLAQRLFVRLVRVQDDGPSTRRRLTHAELDDLIDDDQPDALGAVLDSFVAHRLITFDATAIQLTHEALVVAWPRLRSWIDENRRELLLRQQIGDAARQWEREGRDAALLYRGSRLVAAQDLDEHALGGLAREFVRESGRRERRRARTLHQTVALLAALLVIAAGGGAEALRQRALATDQRNEALSRLVAIRSDRLRDTDPAVAAQLALAAYDITPTLEARSSLLDSSATPAVTRMHSADGVLLSVAVAGSQDLVATAGADHTVRLWDVTTPEHPTFVANGLPGHSGTAETVAFHPTRPMLAVGGDEGARLYDVSQPAAPVDLGVWSDAAVTALAFSADGARLVATSADGTVRLWSSSNEGLPIALGAPVAVPEVDLSVATLSPDGRVLAAAGSDRHVYLWDVTDPAVPVALGTPLVGPTLAVFRTAFSPDGRTLAVASADRHVYLWDLTDPAQPRPYGQPLAGPANWVHTVAFSPDGTTVAAGDSDGLAWLWRLDTGALVGTLPHPGPVTNVVFDRDGRSLYTGAADGVLRRWAIPGPVLHGPTSAVYDVAWSGDVLAGASGDGAVYVWDVSDQHRAVLSARLTAPNIQGVVIGSMAISPDGRTLVAGGYDGTVWRWDISDPSRPAPIEPPLKDLPKYAESLVFSPDGRLLAAGGADGTIALWDVGDPRRPALLTTLEGATANVYAVAFSPDGRTFAAGGFDMVVWLWDVSDPAHPVRLGEPLGGPTNFVYSVAFHPGGRMLAVGSADGTVRLWDVGDRARPTPGPVITGPNGYVIGIAFNPDGSRIAASSTDRTVWLWDIHNPIRPTTYAVLTGPGGTVQDVAYAPDGRSIAATSQDTTVRIWRTEPSDAADLLCLVAGETVTPKEWRQHVPDLPFRQPCAGRVFAQL